MSESYLSCPSCGEEVKALPVYPGNREFPEGYWSDGDSGKCHCGTECFVAADGEKAWLEVRDEEPTAPAEPTGSNAQRAYELLHDLDNWQPMHSGDWRTVTAALDAAEQRGHDRATAPAAPPKQSPP